MDMSAAKQRAIIAERSAREITYGTTTNLAPHQTQDPQKVASEQDEQRRRDTINRIMLRTHTDLEAEYPVVGQQPPTRIRSPQSSSSRARGREVPSYVTRTVDCDTIASPPFLVDIGRTSHR